MNKKNLCIFFISIIFSLLVVSCPDGHDYEFNIEVDKKIVKPTETITFKVTKCTGKLDPSKTVWYVNGVR